MRLEKHDKYFNAIMHKLTQQDRHFEHLEVLYAGLPKKDELYNKIDNILARFERCDNEVTVHGGQIRKHQEEILQLREHVGLPA